MNFLDLIWLIPIVPLIGAAIMLAVGRQLSKSVVSAICPGAVGISFILSLGAVVQLASLPEKVHQVVLFKWLPLLKADMGFLLDPLSSVMILVVTGIGLLIHIYSIGYMAHEHGPRDGGFYRFFGYLNLFVFFMLTLVLAQRCVAVRGLGRRRFVLVSADRVLLPQEERRRRGQEGVHREPDRRCRVHSGHVFCVPVDGVATFVDVNEVLRSGRFTAEVGTFGVLSLTALLLFVGATGKSAQLPLCMCGRRTPWKVRRR